MTDRTINEDVHQADTAVLDDIDPVAAFLKDLTGEADPSTTDEAEQDAQETEETTETEETEEGPEDPADEAEETTETAKDRRQAADDDEVIVQVGDEAKRVSVKDLKRLFGQEASLTQKSQKVAEAQKGLDLEAQKYSVGLDRMAKDAAARWQEYQKIDWLLAKDAMEPQAFETMRKQATEAMQSHNFYQEEIKAFSGQMTQKQSVALQAKAQEAVQAIKDPANASHIPNWSPKVYDEIRAFTVNKLGAPAEVINQIVDPWAIKLMHMAMKQAAAEAAGKDLAKAKPVVKGTPKTVVTSKQSPTNPKTSKQDAAVSRLQRTGDVDDAAEAFLAGWGVTSD